MTVLVQVDPGMATAHETIAALSPLAALVPLGISPFLALGLFGLAAHQLAYGLPPALAVLSHPAIWTGLLTLAVLLWLGRSFKLTKPLVEVAGTTESLLAFVAFAAMFLTPREVVAPAAGAVLEASVAGTVVMVAAAVSGLVMVTFVRMGIDLLTWLSPIPLIDALLQFAKGVATLTLVTVAVLAPTLAVVLNVVLLATTVLVARWLFLVARFMVAVLWGRTWGTFSPHPVPIAREGVGPVRSWSLSAEGALTRFAPVEVSWTPTGGWSARLPGSDEAVLPLGPSTEVTLIPGFIGTTLATPVGPFLFTARHARAMQPLSEATSTPLRMKGGEREPASRPI